MRQENIEVLRGGLKVTEGNVVVTGSVDVTGSVKAVMPVTTKAVTATNTLLVSVVIAAANVNRKAFSIWNNGSNSAYVTFGATSTSAAPTFILATFTSITFFTPVVWTGQISAIRNAGSGNMVVTEFFE